MARTFPISVLAAVLGIACGSDSEGTQPPSVLTGDLSPRPCPASFTERDGNPATICETDFASSATNCGQCGRVCEHDLMCGRGACVLGSTTVQVVAGTFASCVRKASGQVLCWGSNRYGQIGDGTNADRLQPTRALVEGAADLTYVRAG